nr:hypothetical protein [Tanacetum cinerariifolium]
MPQAATVEVGPWGGAGGTPFPDQGHLTKIKVVCTQDCVHSIQFTYLDNSNIEQYSPTYGSKGPHHATPNTIIIEDGEKITGISGTVGSYDGFMAITSLCIIKGTNVYPHGTPSRTPFSLRVTSGETEVHTEGQLPLPRYGLDAPPTQAGLSDGYNHTI